MNAIRLLACVLFLGPSVSFAAARGRADDGSDHQPPPPSPAAAEKQYQALVDEYNDAFQEYAKAFRAAKLPVDREKAIRDKYPRPDRWASKFLELAEKNPGEPFAEEALIWILTSEARLKRFLPWHEHTARYEMIWITQARMGLEGDSAEQEVRSRAIDRLIRDHVASPRMGFVARMLTRHPKSGNLLRAILDKNPDKEIRAEACLALYRELEGSISMARQLKDNPQNAKSAEAFYGKVFVQAMLKADIPQLESEQEKIYAELIGKYILEMQPARLVELCQELRYTADSEKLLRVLYEKDKRDEVRGVACLFLAQALEGRAFSLAASDPARSEQIQKESEALLGETAGRFADVEIPREGSVGRKAEGVLFDRRHLSVGKPSPDIEGVDQDGRELALSDYKGKVVLLDFWSEF